MKVNQVIYIMLFGLLSIVSSHAIAPRKALIFGVTGQDGAYLAEFLLAKGYEVHGVKRRTSLINTTRIDHLYEAPDKSQRNFFLHYGDLSSASNVIDLMQKIRPDEVYNLGAQSHVLVSFELPEYTGDVDGLGVLRILDAIRILGLKKTRFYQASSSEMFGKVQEIPQTETTPFYPRSPYGVAKLYGYWITKNYRESYGMFATNGILFNHESPIRGETFVTRKIARAAARIRLGLQEVLYLGNLDASRDWGHARDYVEAMWLILQQDEPDDFVIATGETHTVREFVEKSFACVGIAIAWQGEGVNEAGYDVATGKQIVGVDPRYFRPAEVDLLVGDASKAKEKLGWQPRVSFQELVSDMMSAELEDAQKIVAMRKAEQAANSAYAQQPIEYVTMAILAKDKAHTLPLYLSCIEKQTWPASKTYLYIRTNNNNDDTVSVLVDWVERVGDRYAGVYFDDSDVPEQVQKYGQHEWNSERFKVLGKIRQDSIDFAREYNSHYFVVDCDNFIKPHTLEALLSTNLPIVAPLLHTGYNLYSNYHAAIDEHGYIADSPFYNLLWNREIAGLMQVPVVHCTYLVRHEALDKVVYDDESYRYEYVIFSDSARKRGIPQYLDTRDMYGRITFAETTGQLLNECWLHEFA